MTTMTSEQAGKIRKMVFIDSTWEQAKQIYKDPRLKGKELRFIPLFARLVNQWRT